MRQVPRYLIIGDGRVARHIQHYFTLLNLPFDHWNRAHSLVDLQHFLKTATHVLLLISDQAIDEFCQHYLSDNMVRIHFSGSLVSQYAYGTHPLMTFSDTLYSLEQYQQIPFIIDDDAPPFNALLPGLSNPHGTLSPALKAKYHALCVLSGNFSCMLWQKFYSELSENFKFPKEILHPYLKQQTQNIIQDYKTALTGPLVRHDVKTIERNLSSLANDPFQEVYQAFVRCYQQIITEELI